MNITCGNNNLYENAMHTTSQYKTLFLKFYNTNSENFHT